MNLNRRELLAVAGAAGVVTLASSTGSRLMAAEATLPALDYAKEALEPYIDAKTMEIHHGKHHQAYINNLNKALADYPQLQAMPLDKRSPAGPGSRRFAPRCATTAVGISTTLCSGK